jgi:hypothetical protein
MWKCGECRGVGNGGFLPLIETGREVRQDGEAVQYLREHLERDFGQDLQLCQGEGIETS